MDQLTTEEWRPTRFAGYLVSNLGRVRSLDRKVLRGGVPIRRTGKILKPTPRGGYVRVRINDNKDISVHTLVAEAFLGPCPEGLEINHKNLNRGDNVSSNLEYITRSANQLHAIENTGRVYPIGEAHPMAKCDAGTIVAAYEMVARGSTVGKAAAFYGIQRDALQRALSGKSWRHLHLVRLKLKCGRQRATA